MPNWRLSSSKSHFDRACVEACRFLPGLGGGVWRAASRLTFVVAWRFLPGFCSGEPCRADVACWGGWGPHTPCARQIGPHPPQPTPPSRHGSLRCVWVRRRRMQGFFVSSLHRLPAFSFSACPRIPVQAHTGSHGRGVSRSDNLCSQRAEDGSPLERAQSEVTLLRTAQSEVTPARISKAQQRHPNPDSPTDKSLTKRPCPTHRPRRGQNQSCWPSRRRAVILILTRQVWWRACQ